MENNKRSNQYYNAYNVPPTDLLIEFNGHVKFHFVIVNDMVGANEGAFQFHVRKLFTFLKYWKKIDKNTTIL